MADDVPADRELRQALGYLAVIGAVAGSVALLTPLLLGGEVAVASSDVLGSGRGSVADGGAFVLVATAEGLRPGEAGDLVVTIENPGGVPIDVQRVDLEVADAADDCAGAAVDVRPWRGSLPVPAEDRATMVLPITLDADAGSACHGVAFPVELRGHAIRAE